MYCVYCLQNIKTYLVEVHPSYNLMGGKTLPTRPKHFSNIFGTLPLPRNLLRRVGWKGWKMNFVIFFQRDTLSTLFSFLSSSLDEKYKSSSSSLLQIRRWKLNLVPKDDFQNAFIRGKKPFVLNVINITCLMLYKHAIFLGK